MRLWLDMNKSFHTCRGIKPLIGIWGRVLDLPSCKEMIGDYFYVLRDESPTYGFPQFQGSLICAMSQTIPKGFPSDA